MGKNVAFKKNIFVTTILILLKAFQISVFIDAGRYKSISVWIGQHYIGGPRSLFICLGSEPDVFAF